MRSRFPLLLPVVLSLLGSQACGSKSASRVGDGAAGPGGSGGPAGSGGLAGTSSGGSSGASDGAAAGAMGAGGTGGTAMRDAGMSVEAGMPWTVVSCGASPPSCVGLPHVCGPNGDGDCCESDLVPGGTFLRDNYAGEEATVGTYCLDRYEITVGRFRRFVAAYPGSKPAAGAGKNPNNPADTGWDPAWDQNLPTDSLTLQSVVARYPDCSQYQYWTTKPDLYNDMPLNCFTWYLAYAFCAWDGGWLPTRVQWDYAARGGADQRVYPWSTPPSDRTPDLSHAVYDCHADGSTGCGVTVLEFPVGSRPNGDGRFGQSDLLGNVMEWLQDWRTGQYPHPCVDCADLGAGTRRALRGGSADSYPQNFASTADETDYTPNQTWVYIGARCARAR